MAFLIKLYLGTLAAFLAIDALWLTVVARSFYSDHLGYLLAPEANWVAAGVFYLLFVAALQVFVVLPGLRAGFTKHVLSRGAFFGLVTYATYDLTNLATVRDWPVIVTIVDLIWGAVLSLTVGLAGYHLGKRLKRGS